MKILKIETDESQVTIKNSLRRYLKFTPDVQQHTDVALHQWVIKELNDPTLQDIDIILIPVVIGAYHMDFLGLQLGLHIRLTPELGKLCYCKMFFYSYSPLEVVMRLAKYYDFLNVPGSYFFRVGLSDESIISSQERNGLNPESYAECLAKLNIPAPETLFDNTHSIANIWGAYVLEQLSGSDVIPLNDYFSHLHFKLVSARFKQTIVRPNFSIQPFLDGQKIALIDDEFEKGWQHVLTSIIQKCGGDLVAFDNFYKTGPKTIQSKIKEFVIENSEINIFLVDLRLFEEDHNNNIKGSDLSGIEVIQLIKRINGGNQVIAFTASNKIWNIDVARRVGADGYYVKESPETHTSENYYENYIRFIEELKRLKFRSGYLKPIWKNFIWVKNNLCFDPYSTGLGTLSSLKSAGLIKEEYAFLYGILNQIEDMSNPKKQQLRYCVLLLVRILEILGDEYIVNDNDLPITFKNGNSLKWFKKVKNSFVEIPPRDKNKNSYKSIGNVIKGIDNQLFLRNNNQFHIQIGELIDKRNKLIHQADDYNLNLNEVIKWQNQIFDLLQAASRFKW